MLGKRVNSITPIVRAWRTKSSFEEIRTIIVSFFLSCWWHTLYYSGPEYSKADPACKLSSVHMSWHVVRWAIRAGTSAEHVCQLIYMYNGLILIIRFTVTHINTSFFFSIRLYLYLCLATNVGWGNDIENHAGEIV